MTLQMATITIVAMLGLVSCKDENSIPAKSGGVAKDIAKVEAKKSAQPDNTPKAIDPLKDGY